MDNHTTRSAAVNKAAYLAAVRALLEEDVFMSRKVIKHRIHGDGMSPAIVSARLNTYGTTLAAMRREAVDRLRAAVNETEFICQKCFLRKDAEGSGKKADW